MIKITPKRYISFHGGRKILEGGTKFRLLYMQKFRPKWFFEKETKNNCRPLAAERPAAAMFVGSFCP